MARPGRSRQQALDDVRRMAPEAAAVMADYMKGDGNEQSRLLRRLTAELAAADDERSARRLAYAVAGVPVEEALKSIDRDERDRAERLLAGLNAAAVDLGAHLAADVFGWLAGFVEHFGEVKRRRSELDFQDLLVLSARVLRRNLAVRRYFQRRFDAFFVDEFQDTDPLQAELIAYLCEDEATGAAQAMGQVRLAEGKLFAVGDPKQSIYRFRRADVQVYDEFKGLFAAGRFGEDRTRQVSCNFRSTGPLLAWFNRLFEHVLGQPVPEGVYQAPHVALQPPERPPEASAAPVLALCAPPGLPTAEKGWHAGDARRHEAHFIARAIEQLTGEAGACRYGDFALLFRSLTDVGYYEDALDARRIPYRVVGGKHFYRREQVAETLALLQAVDDPLNEAAVVGALRSSYFGLSDEELFRYRERGGRWNYLLTDVRSGPVGEAMGMLADWHARRNRALPHVLLREVFAATRAPQAFLLKPAGAQRVANLRKLSNQLRQLGRATGNFSAVVRHLSAVQEAELPEEESSTVEPGDDFVLLMTMHKSKGLQFGAVVLPDLGRDFGQVEKVGPLVLDRQDGSAALALGRGLRSEGYERLAERERGNQLAEVRRLLYVACTRARRLLVLPLYWWRRGDRESLQKLLMDSGCLAGPAEVPFGKERDGVRYLDIRPWLAEMEVGIGPARSAAEAREEVAPLLEERGRWQERHEALVAAASAGRRFVLPSAVEAPRSGGGGHGGTRGRPGRRSGGPAGHGRRCGGSGGPAGHGRPPERGVPRTARRGRSRRQGGDLRRAARPAAGLRGRDGRLAGRQH
ncbi:MAG: hypothetical protein AMK73_02500 [Planctomycetes bacterium SM23_32]|nr:MAG: hypothetical protein AMK73_02500 [Planctomycetes bacterium SM23_32]